MQLLERLQGTSWEKLQNGEPAHFSLLEKISEYENGDNVKVLKKHSRYKLKAKVGHGF